MVEGISGDEVRGRNATMVWDGLGTVQFRYDGPWIKQRSTLARIVRKKLVQRTVPVEAVREVELVMPGGTDDPTIRLVLRDGVDPITAVAGTRLNEHYDPYRLDFSADQWLLADYYAQEIRTSIRLHQLADQPADRWLLPPPEAPTEFKGFDAKVSLTDGVLDFDWSWTATPPKKATGKQRRIPVAEITGVEWGPCTTNLRGDLGYLRITTAQSPPDRPTPDQDPDAVVLTVGDREVEALCFAARLVTLIPRRPADQAPPSPAERPAQG